MFEDSEDSSAEHASDPQSRAEEKVAEVKMHAEIAAVFEGVRKFEADIIPTLDMDIARQVQRAMVKLDKSRKPGLPIIPPEAIDDARFVLDLPETRRLSTNDYHVLRRPGEVMIIRWIQGEQVESFYKRLQAHVDAAVEGVRDDERSALEWKKDPQITAYLDALDKIKIDTAQRYLRPVIQQHKVFVLSTQTADEINISFLTDQVMGVLPHQLLGPHNAPAEGAGDSELAWFYRLFALRGEMGGVEKMCFFTFLQKSDDSFDF